MSYENHLYEMFRLKGNEGPALFGSRERTTRKGKTWWPTRLSLRFLLTICSFAAFAQMGFMLVIGAGSSTTGLLASATAGFGLGMGNDLLMPIDRESELRRESFQENDHSAPVFQDLSELELQEPVGGNQPDRSKPVHRKSRASKMQDPVEANGPDLNVPVQERKLSISPGDKEPELRNDQIWPKPDGWEKYRFGKIRKYFKCKAYAHDQTKPLPTLEDWTFFQSRYREIVDNTASFDDPTPPTLGYTLPDGGRPPFYAKHSDDGRGRGLFASRDIRKGELTHDGTRSDVMFPDGHSWRRYVFSLPRNRACDVIDWTWTQKLEEDGEFRIFAAMNISVFHNSGHRSANVLPMSPTSSKFYAIRDIKKGEELLTDYRIYETVWNKVGLGEA